MVVEWKSRRQEKVISIGLDQRAAHHSHDEVFEYRHCRSAYSKVVGFDFNLYLVPD
jgi:hypothetical protein